MISAWSVESLASPSLIDSAAAGSTQPHSSVVVGSLGKGNQSRNDNPVRLGQVRGEKKKFAANFVLSLESRMPARGHGCGGRVDESGNKSKTMGWVAMGGVRRQHEVFFNIRLRLLSDQFSPLSARSTSLCRLSWHLEINSR